jgi:hypothetical protein
MCVPTQQPQKPDPNMLGSGMAAQAGLAIRDRKKQLDDQIKAAGG